MPLVSCWLPKYDMKWILDEIFHPVDPFATLETKQNLVTTIEMGLNHQQKRVMPLQGSSA
jgi:hypothetical protein